jgi:L-serine dehydratase
MGGEIQQVLVEFDPHGSLATTHESQGSDMGLFGGLLGWEAADDRLVGAAAAIREAGIRVRIEIADYGAAHPNTYRLTLSNTSEQHTMTAISTGGGMIEVIEIDGAVVSLAGDYCETLVYLAPGDDRAIRYLENALSDEVRLCQGRNVRFAEVKGQRFLEAGIVSELCTTYSAISIRHIRPVLPVLSRREIHVPFITCAEMLRYNEERHLDLWELAVHYESARGDLSHDQVFQQMRDIVSLMQSSILKGIEGTTYADRILGYQSGSFREQMAKGRLLDGGMLNQIILYVTAMMEMKSSMGVIVAAPTAGACAGLPGACIGAAAAMGLSLDEMTKAMLAAGMIGVFIAAHATFAAEVGGCQAECGAGSGMAAAALVTLAKGSAEEAVSAASMSLQNILGMICDPVANRVEVPCLGKNVMAASNALACANMALADFDPVIPLDEVIETMDSVGKSLPAELRCTALGGLSVTKTSKQIEEKLGQGRHIIS